MSFDGENVWTGELVAIYEIRAGVDARSSFRISFHASTNHVKIKGRILPKREIG